MENESVSLVAKAEEDQISRKMMTWINSFPELPVAIINYEQLRDDEASMALSTIQSTYITNRDILGGHEAEYQFKIVYRIKPGNSNDKRLSADELLNRLGDWAAENPPNLGENIWVQRIEPTTRSSLFAAYDNGDEDHQILLTMDYEVH